MRALFFLNSFHGGGAEKVCLNLAKRLYDLNIYSDIITVFNKNPDYDIPGYICLISLGLKEPVLTRVSIAKCVPRVNEFISGKNYILITAHLNPAQYLASLTKVGKKTLYVMHLPQPLQDKKCFWYHRIKIRRFLNRKKIVTVSKGMENELCCNYGIDIGNIITIYNPCDIKNLKQKAISESPHDRKYILFMGRLEEVKNPQMALELFFGGRFYKDYDLIYLGKGSLERSLRKKVMDLNLENQVFFAGFQKDPEGWLANASLLLSCSRQEAFALNIAEALICGTPVVAADCPYGPGEILTDELSGYLIHPEREFDKSVSVIASALKWYPKITEKYYEKFTDKIIILNYLEYWKRCFGVEDNNISGVS